MVKMVRIWNISDHPNTSVEPCTLMVLGRTVAPGRSVMVEQDRLAAAHKLQRDIERQLLFVGDALPADYRAAKQAPRAKVSKDAASAHGEAPVEAIAAAAPAVVEKALTPEVVEEKGDRYQSKKNKKGW